MAAVLLTNVPMSCKSIEQRQQQQRGSFDVTMNIFCSELQCPQRCQLSRGISFPFTLVFVSSYNYLPPAILLSSPLLPGIRDNGKLSAHFLLKIGIFCKKVSFRLTISANLKF